MGRIATQNGIGPKNCAKLHVRQTITRSKKMYRSATMPGSRIALPRDRNPTYPETAAMPPTPQTVKLSAERVKKMSLRPEASDDGKRWKSTRKQSETNNHL